MSQPQTALSEAACYRAAREHCRATAGDLYFASHMLTRPQRHALYSVYAVVDQLRDIIGDCRPAGAASSCQSGSCEAGGCDSGPVAATPTACEQTSGRCDEPGAAGCATSGGCCGGESPEQRRHVCMMVLDFLYSGQKTGKPQLDAFHGVAQAQGIERGWFEALVDGIVAERQVTRVPTWSRLRSLLGQSAGMAARIGWQALRPRGDGPLSETTGHQVVAWATALRLVHVLAAVRVDWLAGRLLLPLEDLVAAGLDDRRLGAWLSAPERGAAAETRWPEFVAAQAQRIASLYRGGMNGLRELPPAAQRAAAVYGELHMALLAQLQEDPAAIMHGPIHNTTWRRLKRVPRGLKLAAMQFQA